MQRLQRKVALVIYDPELGGSLEIMQTDWGWWNDINQLRKLLEGVVREKKLIDAWAYAGISKKQWRHFIRIHPTFNWWRRARKSKRIPKDRLPELIVPDPFSKLKTSEPQDVVAMQEDLSIEIKNSTALVPMGLFKKKSTSTSSNGVILLPPSPSQQTHYLFVRDRIAMRDDTNTLRKPDMDGPALERAMYLEKAREAKRARNEMFWKEQHKNNPLVQNGSIWVITRTIDK